jgi:hypothetical protein
MTYNRFTNKIYIANGLKNGNNLTVINADTMAIEKTITLQEKVFNIDYDPITRTYVSIVPIAGNQRVRTINLYNDEFKKLKSYQVDYVYPDMNNNGAFMLNGAIMSATLGSLVECTPFGTVKQIIEINRETEIEDIAYYNGKFYFSVLTQKPNKRHQVDIYVGDPNYDFENSINMQRLKNLDYLGLSGGKMKGPIIMPNNTSVQVTDTNGAAHHAVKMSTGNSMEFGMSDNRTVFLGTSLGYYDKNKNKTFKVLTEDDVSGTNTGGLMLKEDAEKTYVKKSGDTINGNLVVDIISGPKYNPDDFVKSPSKFTGLKVGEANEVMIGGRKCWGTCISIPWSNSNDNRVLGCQLYFANSNDMYIRFDNNSSEFPLEWRRVATFKLNGHLLFANGAELWVD